MITPSLASSSSDHRLYRILERGEDHVDWITFDGLPTQQASVSQLGREAAGCPTERKFLWRQSCGVNSAPSSAISAYRAREFLNHFNVRSQVIPMQVHRE